VSFLLDTNVVSELRKGVRANRSVLSWFERVPSSDLYLSVLVVGELRQGVERVRARDPLSAKNLERWLKAVTNQYADRILPITVQIGDLWGRLNAASPHSQVDSLLAATALVHRLTLVTRNVRHVERTGVDFINPF
jgi:predicted nucleic acid-binding protein